MNLLISIAVLISVLILFVFIVIKYTNRNIEKSKNNIGKKRVYHSEKFKTKKSFLGETKLSPYPIPDTSKVNFYLKNSTGGEGFVYKINDGLLWKVISENRYIEINFIHSSYDNFSHIEIIWK